jgi:hypothetical protein
MPKPPQPDFQALFFAHFGRQPKRQRYELRFNSSNLHHDVVFLTSLVHDARLTRASVKRRGSKLTLDLLRDAWELDTVRHAEVPELLIAPSRLTIAGVIALDWGFEDRVPECGDELEIQSVEVERATPARRRPASVVLQDRRKPRRDPETPPERRFLRVE